ncbi:hypothetical protein KY385_04250 [Candidatus Parcubacteria bacterium]|nr:hypothetical protein [Candidatus Parcubacteria bacterium]
MIGYVKMDAMNADQIYDLKQFIDSKVSQTEALLRQDIKALNDKVDEGFAGVGEAIEQINDKTDSRDKKTDLRLTKLENQVT